MQLYRSPPHKKNELTDFSLTLEKIGISGGTVEDQQRAVIFYDFKPALASPLLLKEPGLMILDSFTEAQEEQQKSEEIHNSQTKNNNEEHDT